MLGEERYLSYRDIQQLYLIMAKSFHFLMHIINERDRIGQDPTVTSVTREDMMHELKEVEALDLDFTLPGSLVVELKNNGTAENVKIWITT